MTDKKDEAMKLALEALETGGWNKTTAAITALRERLAKPEQTISMTEYKRLQDLVTSQGIRLMEYESAHPKQEPFCYHDGRNIVGKEFADHSDVFPLYTSPQPAQQEPVAWKLVPREPTHEMLKAMDECSTEGYDERLYAGHASSVYMAAVDAAPTPPAQPQQEPVVWMYVNKSTHETKFQKHMRDFVDHSLWSEVPLYGEPLANHELQCVCGAVWCGDEMVHLPDKHPPAQRTWVGLTDEEIGVCLDVGDGSMSKIIQAIEAKLKEKNT